MSVNELLIQKNMTKYRLCKESGVPQATISDICSGKTSIEKCSAETIFRIARVLNVSMESLITPAVQRAEEARRRPSFELFKSNVCHRVKDMGDIPFIVQLLESNQIRKLYEKKWYPEALYLLAMLDYLSRENNVPICKNYNDIRAAKDALLTFDDKYPDVLKENNLSDILSHLMAKQKEVDEAE